jgi:hypothetical protein
MQIELIGCTSAGKSTLLRGILKVCREQEIEALSGDDFVLEQIRLNWVKSYLARTLLVDLFSLFACLLTWRKNLDFYLLTFRTVLRLPATVTWFTKLNIVRNTLKKIGIYEIIQHCDSAEQIVLLDEGTLHTAHYLFVHLSTEPSRLDLSIFARLVPLPDMAIYLRQDEAVLIERTLNRGHKRIPDGSYAKVRLFIKRAVDTFDNLVQHSGVERRLLVVDNQQNLISGQDDQNDPSSAIALKIVRAGISALIDDKPARTAADASPQNG